MHMILLVLFLRYVLPVLATCYLHWWFCMKDSKWYGLIIPAILLVITTILIINAHEMLGMIFAFCIMFIPNLVSIIMYILIRNYRKKQDEKIIKLKFGKK